MLELETMALAVISPSQAQCPISIPLSVTIHS